VTVTNPAASGQTSQTSTVPSVPQVGSEGPIEWSSAGQLVIDYFGSAPVASRWAMLTPEVQQSFGSLQAFEQYWAAYPQVSSRNARPVRPNADNSVTVPVDVTYASGNQQHKELRVVKVGGQLRIASEAR
jgi:hypothetical protein